MKVKSIINIWLVRKGHRFDSKPFMSGVLEVRGILENMAVEKMPLDGLAKIYHAGRESRAWVRDPGYGTPFLGSSSILAADLSNLPLISNKKIARKPRFIIHEGWTLITRSGTVGRMVYARPGMDGMACSEDVLRVVPDPDKIPPGCLYAYLSSKFGVPQVVSGIYGAIIQHIEPKHVQDLLVPEIPHEVKIKSHRLVNNAANLITEFLKELETATTEFFKSVGLSDISAFIWHGLERDFDFFHPFPNQESFRALNFNSRFKSLVKNLKTVSWHPLGKVCLPGTLKRCGRYKRVNAKPPDAYSLIGQKQLFTLRPRGRWIAKSPAGKELLVGPGTVLVAAQGTLGESELYCRSAFIWGKQLENAYSEHLLRVIADENIMLSGCLFAFMRSETAFRMLRSISMGTKLQDHHPTFLRNLPVPYPPRPVQKEIHKLVIGACEKRQRAIELEDEAIALVESAIEQTGIIKLVKPKP